MHNKQLKHLWNTGVVDAMNSSAGFINQVHNRLRPGGDLYSEETKGLHRISEAKFRSHYKEKALDWLQDKAFNGVRRGERFLACLVCNELVFIH